MATLRQLLTKAFAMRDENWPVIDLDNFGEYCPVEDMPGPDDETIEVGTASEGTIAEFPLDVEMDGNALMTVDGQLHFLTVNHLQQVTID